MTQKLTEANFVLTAVKVYEDPRCEGVEDVKADIERFRYLNRAFLKYQTDGVINERIVLNHLIILFNVFGAHTVRFLFFKIRAEHFPVLISFLAYLRRLEDQVEINNKFVDTALLDYDADILERLSEL